MAAGTLYRLGWFQTCRGCRRYVHRDYRLGLAARLQRQRLLLRGDVDAVYLRTIRPGEFPATPEKTR